MTPGHLVWYINGYMAPEIYVERGRAYKVKVEGGNNPYATGYYHPFIVTDEPNGGYGLVSDEARKQVKVFAGVQFSRRGQPRPAAGNALFF